MVPPHLTIPAPFSAPFSCLFLLICLLCLFMAFLLSQNLPWIWSWLCPDSSLRVLSFPSSVCPAFPFCIPESICLVHIGSHIHPGPVSCGQGWPVEPFGMGTQVCVPASPPCIPLQWCWSWGCMVCWGPVIWTPGERLLGWGEAEESPAVLMASGVW